MRVDYDVRMFTAHDAPCPVCGRENVGVTQPRDFGYPVIPGFKSP